MAKNIALNKIKYSPSSDWVPVLLPRIVVKELLKENFEAESKEKVYIAKLRDLQEAFKKAKLFEGMTKEQIMEKLHKTRKQLLQKNPHAYINYNS